MRNKNKSGILIRPYMNLINLIKLHKYLLIIIILGFAPLTWYMGHGDWIHSILAGYDGGGNTYPLGAKGRLFYAWNKQLTGGAKIGCDIMLYSPQLFFYLFFNAFGLPNFIINKCWFVSIFMLSGISVFFLAKTLFKEKTADIRCFASAIVYMFNPFHVINFYAGHEIVYAALPLVLILWIKGHEEKENRLVNAILFSLSIFLMPYGFLNPAFAIITFCLLSLYTLFYFISNIKDINYAGVAKFILFSMITTLFFHSWWIVFYLDFTFGSKYSVTESYKYLEDVVAGGINLEGLVTLKGFLPPRGATHPVTNFYDNHPAITHYFVYVLPGFVIMGLVFSFRKAKAWFFLITALLGLYFSYGTGQQGYNTTLKYMWQWMFMNIPGFFTFRHPEKWMVVTCFSYAILFGFSVSGIYSVLCRASKYLKLQIQEYIKIICFIISCVPLLIVFYCSLPLITGNITIMPDGSRYHIAKIPDYWLNVGKIISDKMSLEPYNGDSRLLFTHNFGYAKYLDWEIGYVGADFARDVLPVPLVQKDYVYNLIGRWSHLMRWVIGDIIPKDLPFNFGKIFGLMNISHVLLQNDILNSFVKNETCEHYIKVLEKQTSIKFEDKVGKLYIYRNEHKTPYISKSQKVNIAIGGLENLYALSETILLDIPSLVFPEQNEVDDNNKFLSNASHLIFSNSNIYDLICNLISKEHKINLNLIKLPKVANENEGWYRWDRLYYIPLFFNADVINAERPYVLGFAKTLMENPNYLLTTSKNPLPISFIVERDDDYEVWGRSPILPTGGIITAEIDSEILSSQSLKNDKNYGFQWFLFGRKRLGKGDHQLSLTGNGETVGISELIIVPVRKIESKYDLIKNAINENEINIKNFFFNTVKTEKSQSISNSFYVPSKEKYMVRARVTDLEKFHNQITIDIDDKQINLVTSKPADFANYYWIYSDFITLKEGIHSVSARETSTIDMIEIFTDRGDKNLMPEKVAYKRLNPCHYRCYVNAKQPFCLFFNETFNDSWNAYINREPAGEKFVGNGFANGFFIDKTGNLVIDLYYKKQTLLTILYSISGFSVLLSFAYLAASKRKKQT